MTRARLTPVIGPPACALGLVVAAVVITRSISRCSGPPSVLDILVTGVVYSLPLALVWSSVRAGERRKGLAVGLSGVGALASFALAVEGLFLAAASAFGCSSSALPIALLVTAALLLLITGVTAVSHSFRIARGMT